MDREGVSFFPRFSTKLEKRGKGGKGSLKCRKCTLFSAPEKIIEKKTILRKYTTVNVKTKGRGHAGPGEGEKAVHLLGKGVSGRKPSHCRFTGILRK